MSTANESDFEESYASSVEAKDATSAFYAGRGFAYDSQTVLTWLDIYLPHMLKAGKVLDLCCGDGVWSRGMKDRQPKLELFGIDIAAGGIDKARSLLPEHAENFIVGDAETALPWPEETFDLIFARGPGLYNQHSMDRPATIAVIEMWHKALKPNGKFLSAFYSDPDRFGTYTNPLLVTLPYNRAPRLTDAVDFTGGKYHHDVSSFLAPFRKAANVEIREYRFIRNNHVLLTRRPAPESA